MKSSIAISGALGLLWLGAIALGMPLLMNYEVTSGLEGSPPPQWPKSEAVLLSPTSPTLILFAHPQCPCTAASIYELSKLMAKRGSRLKAYVLFFDPMTVPEHWNRRDIWKSARAIPGVTVLSDVNGKEAHLFGAHTSGQTVVYDSGGRLLFTGGITGARGRIGGNSGLSLLISTLDDKATVLSCGVAKLKTALVFGCSFDSLSKDRSSEGKSQ
jgi:hypothetical protein